MFERGLLVVGHDGRLGESTAEYSRFPLMNLGYRPRLQECRGRGFDDDVMRSTVTVAVTVDRWGDVGCLWTPQPRSSCIGFGGELEAYPEWDGNFGSEAFWSCYSKIHTF